MKPVEPAGHEIRPAVFTVPNSVVIIKRWSGISLGASGLVIAALFYPWHDPIPPDSIDHIFWPMIGVSVAVLLAFIWFRWNRIPPGAKGGALRIGPDGIDYRVGPDHIRLDWSQIAAVYPVTRPSDTRVRAMWLPRDDAAPPNSSRRTLLEIAHVRSPYRPVERPDGVLLPLGLFGTQRAKGEEILGVVQRHHAEARLP